MMTFAKVLIILSSLKSFDGEFLMESIDEKWMHDEKISNDISTTDHSDSYTGTSQIVKWYEDSHGHFPMILPFTNADDSTAAPFEEFLFPPDSENGDQLFDSSTFAMTDNNDMNDIDTKDDDINNLDIGDYGYDVNDSNMDTGDVNQRVIVKEGEVILEVGSVEDNEVVDKRDSKKQTDISKKEYNTGVGIPIINDTLSIGNSGNENKTTPLSTVTTVLSASLDSRLKRLEELVNVRREIVDDYNSRYYSFPSYFSLTIIDQLIFSKPFKRGEMKDCRMKVMIVVLLLLL